MTNRRYNTAHTEVAIGHNEEQGHYIFKEDFDELHNFQGAEDLVENLETEEAAIKQLKERAAIDESECGREIEWISGGRYLAF